jgi:6-phosphogluconate dehydrogenase (decarboxylating)
MVIGFIGIGMMGGGLARNLIRAGKEVLVYDLSPEAVQKTLAAGATGKAARTLKDMAEHIDYDCSAILSGELTLEKAGDQLLDLLARTCNGRLTSQEILGHEEFVLTKLYESA